MFCPDNCKYLSITEKEQDEKEGGWKIPHICNKTGERIKHGQSHPKLIQLESCKREIINRKFDR